VKKDAELTRKLHVIMAKSKNTLKIAKQLYEQDYCGDSISRVYYIVFFILYKQFF